MAAVINRTKSGSLKFTKKGLEAQQQKRFFKRQKSGSPL
jgi:hypothetical protein